MQRRAMDISHDTHWALNELYRDHRVTKYGVTSLGPGRRQCRIDAGTPALLGMPRG